MDRCKGATATDNMDADKDIANTLFDDKESSGPRFSRACDAPGICTVTLIYHGTTITYSRFITHCLPRSTSIRRRPFIRR